jgi:4-carboxymuconolactone decarboxylase
VLLRTVEGDWPFPIHYQLAPQPLAALDLLEYSLRGQLRIALNNGVTKEEIAELFIHVGAYAGAARAFDSYQVARDVFAENAE